MPSNCTYGCLRFHTTKKLSLFKIPKDEIKRKLWEESLGKTLKKTSQVCELHFDKEDILTEKLFTDSSGKVIGVGQYQKKMLKSGAIPKPCSLITVSCASPKKEPSVNNLVLKNYRKYSHVQAEVPVVSTAKLDDASGSSIETFQDLELDDYNRMNDFDPLMTKYVLFYIDK